MEFRGRFLVLDIFVKHRWDLLGFFVNFLLEFVTDVALVEETDLGDNNDGANGMLFGRSFGNVSSALDFGVFTSSFATRIVGELSVLREACRVSDGEGRGEDEGDVEMSRGVGFKSNRGATLGKLPHDTLRESKDNEDDDDVVVVAKDESKDNGGIGCEPCLLAVVEPAVRRWEGDRE